LTLLAGPNCLYHTGRPGAVFLGFPLLFPQTPSCLHSDSSPPALSRQWGAHFLFLGVSFFPLLPILHVFSGSFVPSFFHIPCFHPSSDLAFHVKKYPFFFFPGCSTEVSLFPSPPFSRSPLFELSLWVGILRCGCFLFRTLRPNLPLDKKVRFRPRSPLSCARGFFPRLFFPLPFSLWVFFV